MGQVRAECGWVWSRVSTWVRVALVAGVLLSGVAGLSTISAPAAHASDDSWCDMC
jgi:hypothetical protein